MSAELVLVRHGETEGQSSIRYHGRSDVALSDLGRAQMRAVAAALAPRRFERVFSSPLRRALEGASLVAGDCAPCVSLEEFAEVDFGLFEGLTADEIRLRYPAEYQRWRRNPTSDSYTYPGGESRAAFGSRVERGLTLALELWAGAGAEPADGCALLVAHRGVIRTIVHRLVGVEPVIELGSIQILKRADRWRPGGLDLTAHLARLQPHAGQR